jgi:hypothetical protein
MNDDALAVAVMQDLMPGGGVLASLGQKSNKTDADAIDMGDMRKPKIDEELCMFLLAGSRQSIDEEVVMRTRCG